MIRVFGYLFMCLFGLPLAFMSLMALLGVLLSFSPNADPSMADNTLWDRYGGPPDHGRVLMVNRRELKRHLENRQSPDFEGLRFREAWWVFPFAKRFEIVAAFDDDRNGGGPYMVVDVVPHAFEVKGESIAGGTYTSSFLVGAFPLLDDRVDIHMFGLARENPRLPHDFKRASYKISCPEVSDLNFIEVSNLKFSRSAELKLSMDLFRDCGQEEDAAGQVVHNQPLLNGQPIPMAGPKKARLEIILNTDYQVRDIAVR